jgi:large subunit ribosomal protein L35
MLLARFPAGTKGNDVPKQKTHKGIAKRVKVSAKGKVRYKRPGKSHLMSGKSGNRIRRLRKPGVMGGAEGKKMRSLVQGGGR